MATSLVACPCSSIARELIPLGGGIGGDTAAILLGLKLYNSFPFLHRYITLMGGSHHLISQAGWNRCVSIYLCVCVCVCVFQLPGADEMEMCQSEQQQLEHGHQTKHGSSSLSGGRAHTVCFHAVLVELSHLALEMECGGAPCALLSLSPNYLIGGT